MYICYVMTFYFNGESGSYMSRFRGLNDLFIQTQLLIVSKLYEFNKKKE